MALNLKQFSRELFEANDRRARAAVTQYLARQGLYVTENPDKYGPDLLVWQGFRVAYYVEVECKNVWVPPTGGDPRVDYAEHWPAVWTSVQLPERKLKNLDYSPTLQVEHWILRSDCQYAVVLSEPSVRAAPLVEVPNRLTGATGERFAQVPLEECSFLCLAPDPDTDNTAAEEVLSANQAEQ